MGLVSAIWQKLVWCALARGVIGLILGIVSLFQRTAAQAQQSVAFDLVVKCTRWDPIRYGLSEAGCCRVVLRCSGLLLLFFLAYPFFGLHAPLKSRVCLVFCFKSEIAAGQMPFSAAYSDRLCTKCYVGDEKCRRVP